jgi:hypothetical protein
LEVNGRLRDVLACLDDLEEVVWEPYRHSGAGRPPRSPLGILKALIVKRFRNIPSDRELYRRFWSDGPERLKRLYRHKVSAERTISRLKEHLNLENHKVKRLRNIAIHALLCIIAMLLIALTAIKHGKPEQIRAITRLT